MRARVKLIIHIFEIKQGGSVTFPGPEGEIDKGGMTKPIHQTASLIFYYEYLTGCLSIISELLYDLRKPKV